DDRNRIVAGQQTSADGPHLEVNLNALADGAHPDYDISSVGLLPSMVLLHGTSEHSDFLSAAGDGGAVGPLSMPAVLAPEGETVDLQTAGSPLQQSALGGDGNDIIWAAPSTSGSGAPGDIYSGGAGDDQLMLGNAAPQSAQYSLDGHANDGVDCPGTG